MIDTILIVINSIGICILIVLIIIIIFKYNNRSMVYDNLNNLVTTNVRNNNNYASNLNSIADIGTNVLSIS